MKQTLKQTLALLLSVVMLLTLLPAAALANDPSGVTVTFDTYTFVTTEDTMTVPIGAQIKSVTGATHYKVGEGAVTAMLGEGLTVNQSAGTVLIFYSDEGTTVVMTMTVVDPSVLASYPSEIGGKLENSALASAATGTITLTANTTITKCVTVKYNEIITLDIGEYTLSSSNNPYTIHARGGDQGGATKATLTILGSGTIANTSAGSTAVNADVNSIMTIGNETDGPTVYCTASEKASAVKTDETSQLTINNGKFYGGGSEAAATGRSIQSHGETTINGGTFCHSVEAWKWLDCSSTLTISGGTFKKAITSQLNMGGGGSAERELPVVSISGGTFSDASVFDYLSDDASIKLGANMTLSSAIEFTSGTLTLDLNGMTVTSQGGDYIKNNGATLTLKDSAGGGKLQATAADTGLIWNRKGNLNIQSGTYESTDYVLYIGSTSAEANNGTVNISGGTLTSSAGNTIDVLHNNILNITGGTLKATGVDGYVISSNNADSKVGNEVNISGTPTLESVQSTAVYHSQRGTLSISGGTIKGTTAVETKAGATTISGGSFSASINPPVYHTPNGNGTSTDGYAVALVENGGYLTEDTVSVSITGGTFSGKVGKETDSEKAGTAYTLAISGGTFSADPTDYLDPASVAVFDGTNQYSLQSKTGNLFPAILHDNAVTDPIADSALCDGSFTANPSVQNGVVEVNLRAANLKEHTNGSSTPGKWIGFALTAPTNAAKFKYAFNTTAEGLATLGELTAVEENVTADNKSGVAFYANASDTTPKTWVRVQWFDASSNALTAPITYHMNIDISPIPSSSNSNKPVQGATTVAAAGQTQTTATEAKLVVDDTKLDKAVTAAKEGASVVVTVPEGKAVASAQVALQSVESMAAKEMVLSVKVGNTSYEMPTTAVDTKAVLAQLGATETEAAPVSVTISITKADATVQAEVEAAAAKVGAEIIGTPTAFEVTASFQDKSVSISHFDTYVQRVIEVTTEQSQKITTAIVHEADSSLRHVPTRVVEQDGKYFVYISSLTNSTYALIANTASFADAQGTWYESFVNELASRKVIDGADADHFEGDRSITRAEFSAILVRALGLPADGDASIFSDVPASEWYAGAVGKAYEYGIVGGNGDGTFEPNAFITRQDAMLMLRQAAKVAEYPLDLLNARNLAKEFKDLDTVSDYAAEAMYWNLNNNFIVGSDGLVLPQDNITRAECATIVLRLLQRAGLIDVRA